MEPKRLLVHLDHSKGCRNRLRAAFALANQFDGKLVGLFVVPEYLVPSYVEAQISVDVMTEVTQKAVARAQDTLETYRELAKDAGIEMDARVVEGQPVPILREHSKYADLMVLGQDDPDDIDNASYGIADSMLLEGACPCVVVPHDGELPAPGKRVLLTWNASRESARALRAALPLLQQAETVVVLSSEPDDSDPQIARGHPHADELAHFLEVHGIESVSSGFGADTSPAHAIIGQAAEMNADLIVMGGYGHARLREIILGGVTRELLKQTPTTLLLAH